MQAGKLRLTYWFSCELVINDDFANPSLNESIAIPFTDTPSTRRDLQCITMYVIREFNGEKS